jgi:hypothetical protein
MFTHMPSVTERAAAEPDVGPAVSPSRLSKSTRIALSVKLMLVMADVSAQLLKSGGLSQTLALARLNS